MTRHEQYRELTRQLFGEPGQMIESVWNGCEIDVQENMLEQLREGIRERDKELERFGGDHW